MRVRYAVEDVNIDDIVWNVLKIGGVLFDSCSCLCSELQVPWIQIPLPTVFVVCFVSRILYIHREEIKNVYFNRPWLRCWTKQYPNKPFLYLKENSSTCTHENMVCDFFDQMKSCYGLDDQCWIGRYDWFVNRKRYPY